MNLITRAQAKAAGLKTYFTGKPCGKGHIAERRTDKATCVECKRALARKYYATDPAKIKGQNEASRKRHREKANARMRAWTQKNAERLRAYRRARYEADPERMRAYATAFYARNAESQRAKAAEWRAKNQGIVQAKSRAYYAKNREKVLARAQQWKQANKEWIRAYRQSRLEQNRIHQQNRRTRQAGGKLSPGLAAKLLKLQRGRCACCRKNVSNKYHLDHIEPLSKGGAHSDANMQILCIRCNLAKSATLPHLFMQRRGFLL